MDSTFTGVTGGNPGGTNVPVPSVGNNPTPAIGGTSNPLVPGYPTGSSAASATNFPAYGVENTPTGNSSTDLLNALSGLNIGYSSGGSPDQQWYNTTTQGFKNAGYPSAVAGLLATFIAQGAGFNPQVAQSMIAALQPQIAQGQANIMEQFGGEGLASSSPAALGLGGFDAQATLDEGQILSNLYEQSVQNYMNVLLSGKKQQSQVGGYGALLGGAGSLTSGVGSLIPDSGGDAGGAAAGAASDLGDI